MMAGWSVRDIPDQSGKRAVVTGATGGLGLETALALARAGAEVVVVGRNDAKGAAALAHITATAPGARLSFLNIDLASLASVAAGAEQLSAQGGAVDLLVNNAGVMALPTREVTADGFERQLATNHLGHFLLTARLLPLLRRAKAPRVVSVSSLLHRAGVMRFDDLQSERRYDARAAYAQSKLANLLFCFELQRRSDAGGWGLASLGAHPGGAQTDLIANGTGGHGAMGAVGSFVVGLIGHSAAAGALPTLRAATDPGAKACDYYGPDGLFELRGAAAPAHISPAAQDRAVAERLWTVSDSLTGAQWP